ncbi:MAG: hypothetical protein A4E53_00642 [Pelotomaculum sp. PtaB.Bin104]|nr:MAG: hypothetical protein A4E53_00642 [Pelotomaculum sp. PtaB.Bin104]
MADQRRNNFIEIKLPGCTVFLLPAEVNRLLLLDQELFAEAIRRGKAILRRRNEEKRREKRCR